MDFTLGAKSGYYVWRPWLMDMDKVMWEGVQPGSGILYGPVLSLVITPDVSVSVAGLFGTQSTAWSDNNNQKWFGPSEVLASGLYSAEMDRMDIDGAVSVRMTDNLKLFAGYKYQMIEFSNGSVV